MGMLAVAGQRMSWRASGAEAAGFFNFIVECPNSSAIRLAASDVGGIWRSTDGGITWSRSLDDGFTASTWKICSIIWWPVFTSSATDAGRVLALAGDSGGVNSIIYESVDFGKTFTTAWSSPGSGAGSTFSFSGDNNGTFTSPVGSGKGGNGAGGNTAISLPPADSTPGDTTAGGFTHPRTTGYMGVVDTTNHLVYFSTFHDGVWRVPYTAGKPWIAPSSPTSPTSPGTGINAPGGSSPAATQIFAGIGKGTGFNTPSGTSDFSDLYATGLTADPSDRTTLYMSTFGNGVWRISNANGTASGNPLYTPGWTLNSVVFFAAGSGQGWPSGVTPISATAGPCRVQQMGWYGSTLILACNNDGIWAIKTPSATPALTNLSAAGSGPDLPVASAGGAGISHWQSLGLCHSSSDGLQHLPQDSSGNALVFTSATKPAFYSSTPVINAANGGANYSTATTTITVTSTTGWNATACTGLKVVGNPQLPPIPVSAITGTTITVGGTLTAAQVAALNTAGTKLYMPAWTVAFGSFNSSLSALNVSNGQTTTPGWVDPWAGKYDCQVFGTTRTWWLITINGFLPDGNNAGYAAIRCPQGPSNNINEVQLSGRSGVWLTQDGFATSHPSVSGILSTFSKGGTNGATNMDLYVAFADFCGGWSGDDATTVTAENLSGLLTGSPYGYDVAVDPVSLKAFFAVAQRNLTSGNQAQQGGYVYSRPVGPPTQTYTDELLFVPGGSTAFNVTDVFSRATSSGWGTATDGSTWTVPSSAGVVADFSTQTSLTDATGTVTGAPHLSPALGGSDGLGIIKLTTTDATTIHTVNNSVTQDLSSGSVMLAFDTAASAVGANPFAGVRLLTEVGTNAAGTSTGTTFYEVRMISGSSGNTQILLRKVVSSAADITDFFNFNATPTPSIALVVPTWGAPPVNTLWQLNWTLVPDGAGGVTLTAWIIDHNGNDSRTPTHSVTLNGTTAVTGSGFTSPMNGLPISGPNIAAGTTFTFISSTSGTLSKPATGSGTVTATFSFVTSGNDNASQAIAGPGNVTCFAGCSALPSSTFNAVFCRLSTSGSSSGGATTSVPGFAPFRLLSVPTNSGNTQMVAFVNQYGVMTKLIGTDTQFNLSVTTGTDNPMGSTQPSQSTLWVTTNHLTGTGSTLPAIYALHPQNGLFRSTDYGATWKQIWGAGTSGYASFSTTFLGGVAIDPAHPDDCIVLTSAGLQIYANARVVSGSLSGTTGLPASGSPSLSNVSMTGGPTHPGVITWVPGYGLIVTNRVLTAGDSATIWRTPSAASPVWTEIDDFPYRATMRQVFALNYTGDSNHILAHSSGNGVIKRALT